MDTHSIHDLNGRIEKFIEPVAPKSPAAAAILRWVECNDTALGIDWRDIEKKAKKKKAKKETEKRVGVVIIQNGQKRKVVSKPQKSNTKVREWKVLREALAQAERTPPRPTRCAMITNLHLLAKRLELTELETKILELLLEIDLQDPLEEFCEAMVQSQCFDSEQVIAAFLGLPEDEVRSCLSGRRLQEAGVIDQNRYGSSHRLSYWIESSVVKAVHPSRTGIADIEKALLGPVQTTDLDWEDFSWLGRDVELAKSVLGASCEEGRKGINILLYGRPGSGKTEFARVLAAETGLTLFSVGEGTERDYEPDREDRLNDLRLAQAIASRRQGSVILFDEMEDLLGEVNHRYGHGYVRAGSKVFLNRVLEELPVPVIWTTNDIDDFDPAYLRRMTIAIEVKSLGQKQRARTIKRMADAKGFELPGEEAAVLARNLPAEPGIWAQALSSAQMIGAEVDDLERIARGIARASGQERGADLYDAGDHYDPHLVNANIDLEAMLERLAKDRSLHNVSFCFSGPPGTGKSAYVRHIADRLGYDLKLVRASDLISKWVGESEENIADAFREARETGQFLLFDEADSLLGDRRGAQRNWEVSQVNEMLTWMESHPLPFACTTNLVERLDQASMRRFLVKARFDYLKKEQVAYAFELFFGLKAPHDAAKLEHLTPADFAVVKKKAKLLGASSPVELLQLLEAECAVKDGAMAKIGFGV